MGRSGRKTGSGLSNEDRALWERVTRTITPIANKSSVASSAMATATDSTVCTKAPSQAREPSVSGDMSVAKRSGIIPERGFRIGERASVRPLSSALHEGDAPIEGRGGKGLDRRTHARMRQGRLPIEGRLDLHGMTQDEAHARLVHFIISAHRADKRALLVITGKGGASPGPRDPLERPQGILRRMLPRWLQCPPLDGIVVDWCLARPQHGGEGAFYVYLRRRR